MKKVKKYVHHSGNKCDAFLRNHIKIGDRVIVIDGSYMLKKKGGRINGIEFQKGPNHELLTVTRVNVPFNTDYSPVPEVLSTHNNCEIKGYDDEYYYCSLINIIKFK